MKGTVVWFDVKKGFGFIKGEDDIDYFAHFSKILAPDGEFRLLDEKEVVEFEPVSIDRGRGITKPQAINIKSIGVKNENIDIACYDTFQ